MVKRYVRKLRKRVHGFTNRLEHIPGKEAQVDFGKATCRVLIGNKWKKVWIFKMTLTCSKHSYEELVEKQDLETFLQCHECAFAFSSYSNEVVDSAAQNALDFSPIRLMKFRALCEK